MSPRPVFALVFVSMLILFMVLAWARTHGILLIKFDSFAQLTDLLLVSATLVVTGVGVVAALIAIYGYTEIKKAAIGAAVEAARQQAATIAKDIAETVAARTALDAAQQTSGTTAAEGNDIAAASGKDGHP